jgi:hypothetical protein
MTTLSLCSALWTDLPDRQFGPHVVRNQSQQLRRSIRGLEREGFRLVCLLVDFFHVNIGRGRSHHTSGHLSHGSAALLGVFIYLSRDGGDQLARPQPHRLRQDFIAQSGNDECLASHEPTVAVSGDSVRVHGTELSKQY